MKRKHESTENFKLQLNKNAYNSCYAHYLGDVLVWSKRFTYSYTPRPNVPHAASSGVNYFKHDCHLRNLSIHFWFCYSSELWLESNPPKRRKDWRVYALANSSSRKILFIVLASILFIVSTTIRTKVARLAIMHQNPVQSSYERDSNSCTMSNNLQLTKWSCPENLKIYNLLYFLTID